MKNMDIIAGIRNTVPANINCMVQISDGVNDDGSDDYATLFIKPKETPHFNKTDLDKLTKFIDNNKLPEQSYIFTEGDTDFIDIYLGETAEGYKDGKD